MPNGVAKSIDANWPGETTTDASFLNALMNKENVVKEPTNFIGRHSIEIAESEFREQFPLVTNHIRRLACCKENESGGCLFETFGKELAFVRSQDPRTIWTLVADGDEHLLSGFHIVNRIGYFVSATPFPENTDIEVRNCGDKKSKIKA